MFTVSLKLLGSEVLASIRGASISEGPISAVPLGLRLGRSSLACRSINLGMDLELFGTDQAQQDRA